MDISKIKIYILNNLKTGLFKTLITTSLTFLLLPIVIYNIGIKNFGIISIVVLFSSVSGIVDLGLSKALILFSGKHDGENEKIITINTLNLSLSIFILILAIIVFTFKLNLFGNSITLGEWNLRILNTFTVINLSLSIFNNLLKAKLETEFLIHKVNWGYLIESTIINGGWFLLSYTNELVYLLFIPTIAMIFSMSYFLLLTSFPKLSLTKLNKKNIKEVFNITFQFFELNFLNSIHLPIIKYIIILFIGNGIQLGIFELAIRINSIINNFFAYISNPFFGIAAQFNKEQDEKLKEIIWKVTKILLLSAFFIYLSFLSFNNIIINYFFKEYTLEIFVIMNLIMIGNLLYAISELIQKYLLGKGYIILIFKVKLLAIIFNLLLVYSIYRIGMLNLIFITSILSLSLILNGLFFLIYFVKKNSKSNE